MSKADYLLVGFLIGVFVGIPVGWVIAQAVGVRQQSSVVFDRDSEGRITAIHYVPGGGK